MHLDDEPQNKHRSKSSATRKEMFYDTTGASDRHEDKDDCHFKVDDLGIRDTSKSLHHSYSNISFNPSTSVMGDHSLQNQPFPEAYVTTSDVMCDAHSTRSSSLHYPEACHVSHAVEAVNKVFIIAATNCPWDIDPAFLRRFQKRCYVPLPER